MSAGRFSQAEHILLELMHAGSWFFQILLPLCLSEMVKKLAVCIKEYMNNSLVWYYVAMGVWQGIVKIPLYIQRH